MLCHKVLCMQKLKWVQRVDIQEACNNMFKYNYLYDDSDVISVSESL